MNEIIADEKDINNEIFLNYFKYQNPLLLVKDLISAKQDENEKLINNIINALIDLRNDVNRKEIPEYKNLVKGKGLPWDLACVVNVFNRKVFDRRQLKILTPKQMLQRFLIALAEVEAGNTSENLLREIRQIIYSLYLAKQITKKYTAI